MVDAAIWVDAAAPVFTWNRGEVLDLLVANRANIQKHIVDADFVGVAIQTFMKTRDEWTGNSTELLAAVLEVVSEETRRQKEWPKAANSFTNKLRAAAPGIRMSGIQIVEGAIHGRTMWELRKIKGEKDPTHRTHPTQRGPQRYDGYDDFGPKSYEGNQLDLEDIIAARVREERAAIQQEPAMAVDST
jgi:hypothetical protein